MKLNLIDFKNKVTKFMVPQENIGGLEINDKVVKFFAYNGDSSLVKCSGIVQVLPGVIKNGFLENPAELLKSILTLKEQITKKNKFIPYIILSLPANNFYTNILTIPKNSVSEGNVTEAIKLNTRMLSPIPLEKAYFD
jgi:Tfp pilus assembly PilM family ATPase